MKYIDNIAHISKAELKALVAHASKDEARPHVNCVVFDADKARAFATDGHRLAVLGAEKADKQGEAVHILTVSGARALIAVPRAFSFRINFAAFVAESFDTIDGRIGSTEIPRSPSVSPPPIDTILPKLGLPALPTMPLLALNPAYLGDLALCDTRVEWTFQFGPTRHDPVVCRSAYWTCLIMPLACNESEHAEKLRKRWLAAFGTLTTQGYTREYWRVNNSVYPQRAEAIRDARKVGAKCRHILVRKVAKKKVAA